jgi:hypothetical protein
MVSSMAAQTRAILDGFIMLFSKDGFDKTARHHQSTSGSMLRFSGAPLGAFEPR